MQRQIYLLWRHTCAPPNRIAKAILEELESAYDCLHAVRGEETANSSASRSAKVLQEAIMETLDKQVKTIMISESLATTEKPPLGGHNCRNWTQGGRVKADVKLLSANGCDSP